LEERDPNQTRNLLGAKEKKKESAVEIAKADFKAAKIPSDLQGRSFKPHSTGKNVGYRPKSFPPRCGSNRTAGGG
jgi:hypothetical protein